MDHVYQLHLSFLHQRLTNGGKGGRGKDEESGGREGDKDKQRGVRERKRKKREGGVEGETVQERQMGGRSK